jgi:hypothetical protein
VIPVSCGSLEVLRIRRTPEPQCRPKPPNVFNPPIITTPRRGSHNGKDIKGLGIHQGPRGN